MLWGVSIFLASALILICSLAIFLQATLSRNDGAKFSASRLGVSGFALILTGMVVLYVRGSAEWRPWHYFLDHFGELLLVSGLIYLFILFCVSLTRTAAKGNGKPDNAVSEFLK